MPDYGSPPSPQDLQFQHAEPVAEAGAASGSSARTCVACKQPVGNTYFHAQGQVVCPLCAQRIQTGQQAPPALSLMRAALYGGVAALGGCTLYALVAIVLRWHPQLGNFLAYVIAVATGYFMHSRWSFKDHGAQRTHGTKLRFAVVSVISYALNSLWVWLLFTHLQFGRAAPIPPMLFITPAVTFILNRQWVFR